MNTTGDVKRFTVAEGFGPGRELSRRHTAAQNVREVAP